MFRKLWKSIKEILDKNEEYVEALAGFMAELVKERNLGNIPDCRDTMDILTRLANGTYPTAKLLRNRAGGNRAPAAPPAKKAGDGGDEDVGEGNDGVDPEEENSGSGGPKKRDPERRDPEKQPVVVDKATITSFSKILQNMDKRLKRIENAQDKPKVPQKEESLRERLKKAGAKLRHGQSESDSSSEADTEHESGSDSDSSVEPVGRKHQPKGKKKRKSRLMARLEKQGFPPIELMMAERITAETLLNIFSSATTVSAYVDSAHYNGPRNKKEARVLARALDFLIADLGMKEMARLRASEVLIRRLAAIHEAEATGEWSLANELDETSWRREMVSEKVRRRMLRSARLSKDVSSLKTRTKDGRDHDRGDGKE